MNKTGSNILILFSFILLVACGGKKESSEAVANNDAWPEMDEFHMVMAESFHPFMDSANMEPAKANVGELARVAEKWANAPLPEKVNTDEVKANLAKLKDEAAAFSQVVQGGDPTKIGEALTSMHNLFHSLQESWYSGGKEEGHDHKH